MKGDGSPESLPPAQCSSWSLKLLDSWLQHLLPSWVWERKEPGRIFRVGLAQITGQCGKWGRFQPCGVCQSCPEAGLRLRELSQVPYPPATVTAQENLPANPKRHGPLPQGVGEKGMKRRGDKNGGGPWRTSRFLSESPTNPTLHPWTHPFIPLDSFPTSHPASGAIFHTTFWVLKPICFTFERIQERLCFKFHPSPVTALGLKGQASG